MPRLFFDLVNRVGRVRDPEGREVADLDEARAVALASMRSILCEDVGEDYIDLRGRIEVRDEAGERVLVIGFEESVEILTGPLPRPEEGRRR